jgi:hypothetical protein
MFAGTRGGWGVGGGRGQSFDGKRQYRLQYLKMNDARASHINANQGTINATCT